MIYKQGISVGRVSELLGISQWEIIDYLGKTGVYELKEMKKARTKLNVARGLFDLK